MKKVLTVIGILAVLGLSVGGIFWYRNVKQEQALERGLARIEVHEQAELEECNASHLKAKRAHEESLANDRLMDQQERLAELTEGPLAAAKLRGKNLGKRTNGLYEIFEQNGPSCESAMEQDKNQYIKYLYYLKQEGKLQMNTVSGSFYDDANRTTLKVVAK
jgi:hypothetical protein